MKLCLTWRGILEVADDEASDLSAIMVYSDALADPSATIEEIRAACLATLAAPRARLRPARAALRQHGPASDPEDAAFEEKLGVRRQIEERLRSSGIEPGGLRVAAAREPGGARRGPGCSAKVPDADIEALLSAMGEGREKPPAPPPPDAKRC